MQERIRAIVTDGRIQPLEDLDFPEGTEVIVTIADDDNFWLSASVPSIEDIWANPEDDIYAELLQR